MPRTLDGMPFCDIRSEDKKETRITVICTLEKPYNFKVDHSVFLNWGQPIDPEHGRSLGIPEEYLGK